MSSEGYEYDLREYVWDCVWEGPAIIIGIDGDRFTLAEIVLPARKLGRVAHRYHADICRYVHLLVPEGEACLLGEAVKHALSFAPAETGPPRSTLVKFKDRLYKALRERGVIDA